jgi:hypothetical protein
MPRMSTVLGMASLVVAAGCLSLVGDIQVTGSGGATRSSSSGTGHGGTSSSAGGSSAGAGGQGGATNPLDNFEYDPKGQAPDEWQFSGTTSAKVVSVAPNPGDPAITVAMQILTAADAGLPTATLATGGFEVWVFCTEICYWVQTASASAQLTVVETGGYSSSSGTTFATYTSATRIAGRTWSHQCVTCAELVASDGTQMPAGTQVQSFGFQMEPGQTYLIEDLVDISDE